MMHCDGAVSPRHIGGGGGGGWVRRWHKSIELRSAAEATAGEIRDAASIPTDRRIRVHATAVASPCHRTQPHHSTAELQTERQIEVRSHSRGAMDGQSTRACDECDDDIGPRGQYEKFNCHTLLAAMTRRYVAQSAGGATSGRMRQSMYGRRCCNENIEAAAETGGCRRGGDDPFVARD
jgi:hypothetical protein